MALSYPDRSALRGMIMEKCAVARGRSPGKAHCDGHDNSYVRAQPFESGRARPSWGHLSQARGGFILQHVAQSGRASAWGAESRGFESSRADNPSNQGGSVDLYDHEQDDHPHHHHEDYLRKLHEIAEQLLREQRRLVANTTALTAAVSANEAAVAANTTAVDAVVSAINSAEDQTAVDAATSAIEASTTQVTANTNALDAAIAPPAVAPTVSGISPTSGTAAGGTPVTVTGSGFTGATAVTFDSTDASNVVVVSDTEVTAESPAGTDGTASVVYVVTPAGTSPAGEVAFTYAE